jgi:creatinine amidohydrolase
VSALQLDALTWPQIKVEIETGRDTVVVAFGATEQHGHHMPLATDALLGDHFARKLADRLDGFYAPTVRVGCSSHHLAFAGTLSFSDETFHAIVADLVSSLVRSGFKRIVLIPTHGGNFAPLAAAIEKLPADQGEQVVGLTDVGALLQIAQAGADEHGIPLNEGGLHAGEWETSMLLAIHPELIDMANADPGYTGDPAEALQGLFSAGVDSLTDVGAIGDPSRASAEHGRRYWEVALSVAVETVEAAGRG